ncbi:MAG: monovalent cation/H+ antiporter complex subunit F [Pseudomonadota bacterium]
MTPSEFLSWSIDITFALVMLSIAIAFIRLARGPSLADRVVALDMMTVSIIAFCGLYAVRTGGLALLDVALVLALVGFLATVALARFADRRKLADTNVSEVEDD